jgi:hypothetical protein
MGTPEQPVDHPLVDHPLHERLGRILARAAGKPLVIGRRGPRVPTGADGVIGANAYLRVLSDRPEVGLAVYPADTLTQAKAFYRRHNALAGVRELRPLPGWHARPNFHFGYFQRGYCWTCNERGLDEYVQLWVRRIEREVAVRREDWDRYWSWLEAERIACPADRSEFDRHFVNSKRPVAVPRPGLALSRRWPLEDAQARSGEDRLRREVRQALDEAVAAFGGSTRTAA